MRLGLERLCWGLSAGLPAGVSLDGPEAVWTDWHTLGRNLEPVF